MANIGDVLLQPEAGYTRIIENASYTNSKIIFYLMEYKRYWGVFGNSVDSSITIYLKNVKTVRFINFIAKGGGSANVYINDELIDSQYRSSIDGIDMAEQTLVLELKLKYKYNKIHIQNYEQKQINFYAIDIDNGGQLISSLEYSNNIGTNDKFCDFIIKKENLYYSIDNSNYDLFNKQYNPITSSTDNISDLISNNTINLQELTLDKTIGEETFKPIDKLLPFKIQKLE